MVRRKGHSLAQRALLHCTRLDSIEYAEGVEKIVKNFFRNRTIKFNRSQPVETQYQKCTLKGMWLNRKWQVGVIATQYIKPHTLLFPVGGRAILFEDIHKKHWGRCIDLVFDEVLIDTGIGNKRNFCQYFNHGCQSNCVWVLVRYCGIPMLWVKSGRKGIKAGSHMTCNYGESYVKTWKKKGGCACSSVICMDKQLKEERHRKGRRKGNSKQTKARQVRENLKATRKSREHDQITGYFV